LLQGQRALRSHRRPRGVDGPAERDEVRVARGVDGAAIFRAKRGPQQTAMRREQVGVAIAQLLEQARRALDVREQERGPFLKSDRPVGRAERVIRARGSTAFLGVLGKLPACPGQVNILGDSWLATPAILAHLLAREGVRCRPVSGRS
jgi:hypothetical protein